MQEFPPNSRKAAMPDEPIKIERVTSAEAERRKKGLGQKLKETFIGGNAKTAVQHVIFSVLIPSAKDMLFDAVESGIRSWIYGDTRPKRGPSTGYSNSALGRFNYQGISSPARREAQPRMVSRSSRARQSFDDLVIPERREAEEVIDRMFDILSRYGSVTVANLYELTGIQSQHTDNKWGWTALPGAKASRLSTGGFLLDLPDPEPLG